MLFGSVLVMAVYAPDSGKDLEEYEKFVEEMTKNLFEGRIEQGPDASTSQAILTSSWDCCVQAMTTSGSSARCTDLNAGRVSMLTRVALRNRCGGIL